jgi:adenylate cyclase
VELAFWESVRESDSPAMCEAYLKKYSEGAFAALAKARLDELRR